MNVIAEFFQVFFASLLPVDNNQHMFDIASEFLQRLDSFNLRYSFAYNIIEEQDIITFGYIGASNSACNTIGFLFFSNNNTG